MKAKLLSRVRPLAWTAAYQAPPSMGFSRQEYWSGVPLPSPRIWWMPFKWMKPLYPHSHLILTTTLKTTEVKKKALLWNIWWIPKENVWWMFYLWRQMMMNHCPNLGTRTSPALLKPATCFPSSVPRLPPEFNTILNFVIPIHLLWEKIPSLYGDGSYTT